MDDELISRQATIKVLLNELQTSNNRVRDYIGGGIDRAVVKLQETPAVNAVVLPCKVRDRIWLTEWWNKRGEWEKLSSPIERHVIYFSIECDGIYAHLKEGCLNVKHFGVVAFLTKEEAEKALGERKVALEEVVDLEAQTAANNEAMRKVIEFIVGERKENG